MTGSHTVQLLLKRGHTVRGFAHNEDEPSMRLQGLGAEAVIGDLLNLNAVRLALSGIRGAYFVYSLKSVTRSVALYSRTVASRSLPATLGTGKQRPTANRPGPAITMGSSAAIASRWYSKPSPA